MCYSTITMFGRKFVGFAFAPVGDSTIKVICREKNSVKIMQKNENDNSYAYQINWIFKKHDFV